jgi:protein-S-isoprenylcysteine O-methyltransferase Ste14
MYSILYLLIGIIGFALLLVFDILSLHNKNYSKYLFGVSGFLMILVSSILIVINYSHFLTIDSTVRFIGLGFAIASFALLIYSVFIEVGKKTYQVENEHALVTSGTYALTRHPGVLWMLLLYIFGAIFFQNLLAIYAALIWTFVNIIYVSIQERFIFHKIFDNYDKYRESTPMILPNFESIEKFMTTKNWRRT